MFIKFSISLFDAVHDAQGAVKRAQGLHRVKIAFKNVTQAVGQLGECAPAAPNPTIDPKIDTPLHVAHVGVEIKVATVARLSSHLNFGSHGSALTQITVIGPSPSTARLSRAR